MFCLGFVHSALEQPFYIVPLYYFARVSCICTVAYPQPTHFFHPVKGWNSDECHKKVMTNVTFILGCFAYNLCQAGKQTNKAVLRAKGCHLTIDTLKKVAKTRLT